MSGLIIKSIAFLSLLSLLSKFTSLLKWFCLINGFFIHFLMYILLVIITFNESRAHTKIVIVMIYLSIFFPYLCFIVPDWRDHFYVVSVSGLVHFLWSVTFEFIDDIDFAVHVMASIAWFACLMIL